MEKSTLEMVFLLCLAAIGWVIALYVYRVYLGTSQVGVWWMPRILQMINCRCDEISDSPFGQTFGKSNAFWGLWYFILVFLVVIGYWQFNFPSLSVIFILVLLAFAHSLYLLWGLLILRVVCRPCIGTHAINGIIFCVLLAHAYPLFFTH